MPAYRSQHDLIDYVSELEKRVAKLEQSAVRIDASATKSSTTSSGGRFVFDSALSRMFFGTGSAWKQVGIETGTATVGPFATNRIAVTVNHGLPAQPTYWVAMCGDTSAADTSTGQREPIIVSRVSESATQLTARLAVANGATSTSTVPFTFFAVL